MRNYLVFILITVLSYVSSAQIVGLSASKLSAFSANSVETNKLEIESGFGFTWSRMQWDQDGTRKDFFPNNDSIMISSSGYARVTYGLNKNSELGAFIDFSGDFAGIGYKHSIYKKNDFSTSVFGGLNFSPLSNNIVLSNYPKNYMGLGLGVISSSKISNNLFWDINLQYFNHGGLKKDNGEAYINSDFGFFAKEHIQLIAGIFYSNNFNNNNDLERMKTGFSTGIAFEKTENLYIIFQYYSNLIGINEVRESYVCFSLLLIMD